MSKPGKHIEKAFENHVIRGLLNAVIDDSITPEQNIEIQNLEINIKIRRVKSRLIQIEFQKWERVLDLCFLYSSTYRFHKENLPSCNLPPENIYVVCCQWGAPNDYKWMGPIGDMFQETYYRNLEAAPGEYIDSAIKIIRKTNLPYTQSFDPANLKTIKLQAIVNPYLED